MNIKLKRARLSAVLSTLDPALPIPADVQRKAISGWATKTSKALISGPEAPAPYPGLRHVKTVSRPPMANLFGTYIQTIPGVEVCMIANPDVEILDVMPLLNHIDAQRMEMAWACHIDFVVSPSVFFMSSPIVAHMINALPQGMTFADDWQKWMNEWMKKMMGYRYFNGTQFNPIMRVNSIPEYDHGVLLVDAPEAKGASSAMPESLPKKRGRPKKVK